MTCIHRSENPMTPINLPAVLYYVAACFINNAMVLHRGWGASGKLKATHKVHATH